MFAILFPYQKEQIENLCWGEACGKGQVGAIDIGHSMAIRCNEESCPFEEKRTESIGTLDLSDDDEPIFVRILKAASETGGTE